MRRVSMAVLLSVSVVSRLGADCCFLEFAPQPTLAGEPVQATYHGVAPGCLEGGAMQVETITGDRIVLLAEPPGCPFLPCCEVEYTATVTLPPLAAGTYQVVVKEGSGFPSNTRAIATLIVVPPSACATTDTALCLGDARFAVTGTVEYELVVRDVESGETRRYAKPLAAVPRLTADTTAFPCAAQGPPHS